MLLGKIWEEWQKERQSLGLFTIRWIFHSLLQALYEQFKKKGFIGLDSVLKIWFLLAPGHLLTDCNAAPAGKYKMATRGPKNGRVWKGVNRLANNSQPIGHLILWSKSYFQKHWRMAKISKNLSKTVQNQSKNLKCVGVTLKILLMPKSEGYIFQILLLVSKPTGHKVTRCCNNFQL